MCEGGERGERREGRERERERRMLCVSLVKWGHSEFALHWGTFLILN